MSTQDEPKQGESLLFGHPTGLFTLFFAEMWERFSYYGMRALLIFYMIKGFLGFSDKNAYAVYGAYGALVYAAPFIGGMLADRLLGARKAVILGGLLMAAGHLTMTLQNETAFFLALALLICGNGFFKPNISTIVGNLYPRESGKKDAGFTIFYMGINLGAAMSPVICGYVGETYGWHYGFGLATIGMLVGVSVFVAPTRVTQMLILVGALTTAGSMLFLQDSFLQLLVRIFLGVALAGAGILSFVALNRGGLPKEAGAPRDPNALSRKIMGVLRADLAVLLGVAIVVPFVALLVWQHDATKWVLFIFGAAALGYLLYEAIVHCTKVERERLFVVFILMAFSMLFWALFEQAGSSMTNFTDRNIDRAFEDRQLAEADVGTTVKFRIPLVIDDPELMKLPLLSQEQLGYRNANPAMMSQIERAIRRVEKNKGKLESAKIDELVEAVKEFEKKYKAFTLTSLTNLRGAAKIEGVKQEDKFVEWKVTSDNVGMGITNSEIPASEFQAVNPIYILLFGLAFTAVWGFLGRRGLDPNPPFKFALGVFQLGLGFVVIWYGAQMADSRGMVSISWLLLAYLLHTTGELCLSPVGLSMVTKISPARLVSTVMGAWFLVTGFSNYLAGMIATFTSVGHGKGPQIVPPPIETVSLYGNVFGILAILAIAASVVCLALAPLLNRWMHLHADADEDQGK